MYLLCCIDFLLLTIVLLRNRPLQLHHGYLYPNWSSKRSCANVLSPVPDPKMTVTMMPVSF